MDQATHLSCSAKYPESTVSHPAEARETTPVVKTNEEEEDRLSAEKEGVIPLIGSRGSLIRQTTSGRLLGFTVCDSGRRVGAFLGILYADPPVGPLRFAASESPDPWRGAWGATPVPVASLDYRIKWLNFAGSKRTSQPSM